MLPGYFKGRTSTIQKGIEEARKMSEDARRRLAEVESRLSRLDADIAAMRREADENAKAEDSACWRRVKKSAAGSWPPPNRKLRWQPMPRGAS